MKGIDEVMRIARMKEQTIGNLIEKLSSVFESSENQLSCLKCMSLMTDAVMLIPCGHALCRTCIKPDDSQQYCPECDKRVTQKSNCAVISDLACKHEINKDALTAFKNEKFWKQANQLQK